MHSWFTLLNILKHITLDSVNCFLVGDWTDDLVAAESGWSHHLLLVPRRWCTAVQFVDEALFSLPSWLQWQFCAWFVFVSVVGIKLMHLFIVAVTYHVCSVLWTCNSAFYQPSYRHTCWFSSELAILPSEPVLVSFPLYFPSPNILFNIIQPNIQ